MNGVFLDPLPLLLLLPVLGLMGVLCKAMAWLHGFALHLKAKHATLHIAILEYREMMLKHRGKSLNCHPFLGPSPYQG